jgi:hypothetical protein
MRPLLAFRVSEAFRCAGLVAAAILATACAQSPSVPHTAPATVADPEPFLAPTGATLEKPEAANSKKNVCADPSSYPPLAFDFPQLSATQLSALANSPSNARELLSNIKSIVDHDLLVQTAFFDDEVLLKFFGAAEITWEKSELPIVFSTPYPPIAFGPTRIAHISILRGPLSNVTVRVVSSHTCRGWRQMPFAPGAWWPPTTYESGAMQIAVSSLTVLDIGMVKTIFGADPDEAPYFFLDEFGGGVSFPGHLTYENHDEERRSAPFSRNQIEFVPQQTGNERPARPGERRVFADDTKLMWINISQSERDL